VLELVLQINDLEAPERIQVGQVLEIPWPTPTPDASNLSSEATEPVEPAGEGSTVGMVAEVLPSDGGAPVALPTETLQPGIKWHTIRRDETIISVAFEYAANLRVLSELNPEITFSQCDFGMASGGPNCVVQLREGQRIRVPAPTSTPTLSPTPSGSETPTPTATPTFNAPSIISPGDRALFRRSELVTLRWVASGTLGPNQSYRITVEDTTAGIIYGADTTELSFIVPQDWQGADSRRHEYIWSVSVIDDAAPDDPYFTTQSRAFIWEARSE
jgi:hypothetical protein